MNVQDTTVGLNREPASNGNQGTRMSSDWGPESSPVSGEDRNVRQVVAAVGHSIAMQTVEPPDEFFPAHLSVAVIDTVFRLRVENEEPHLSPAERYCRRFGIPCRRRKDMEELPRSHEQETLEELIAHFDELGVDGMAYEVFRSRESFPGTKIPTAEYVLRVANKLRRVGVRVLQDVDAPRVGAADEALRSLPAVDEHFAPTLLMYTGADNFVLCDDHLRRFVGRAIGQKSVSADEAIKLVRQCAYELILSPRYLGYQIWRYGVSRPADPPTKSRHRAAMA